MSKEISKIELPAFPRVIERKANFSLLEIKPCHPGYGITLGNALRRVLISSLPGAAVTAIKIDKVSHEFSGIPYILEDVVQIMLNFKQLRLKIHSVTNEPISLSLSTQGEKIVTAKDIICPNNVEIINKDLHLATMTDKKASLALKIIVEKGIGYSSVDERPKDNREIGMILLDAVFTPIRRVNYRVENMRVGERTDFNRLLLEIETDGTVSPEEAFINSVELLVDHFNVFLKLKKEIKLNKNKKTKGEKEKEATKANVKATKANAFARAKKERLALKKMTIDELKLSARVLSILRESRLKRIMTLAEKSEEQLLELPGLGERGVKEIKREMGKLGLLFK